MRLTRYAAMAAQLGTVVLCAMTAHCSSDSAPTDEVALKGGDTFVPVYRSESPAETALHGETLKPLGTAAPTAEQSFYLAIRKSDLASKWFLSAFMKQYFPGAVSYGAARSLGTRVISFSVQNGKLFIFDVSDRTKTSDTFDPNLVVDAFPIVTDYAPFNRMLGSDQYVLIDPAAGLDKFGVMSTYTQDRFVTEVAFSQRFRKISDGVTYEQVFSGYGTVSDPDASGKAESNPYKTSGTLGIALRKYQEGADFQARPLPPKPYYFVSDVRIVPNEGKTVQNPVKWNIHPGMQPIKWVISHHAAAMGADPKYVQYNLVDALKHGIEDWNQVFGFKVFEASVATPDESYADDDKNYLIWDADPSYGAAFANWRTNPNSGEIRGASVYINASWLTGADASFVDDKADGKRARPLPLARQPKPQLQELTWAGMPEGEKPCMLWAPAFRDGDGDVSEGADTAGPLAPAAKPLTKVEKVWRYVKNTVLHEIGHDLGLRHNFRGSNVGATTNAPSSSIMDYLTTVDDIAVEGPGPHDIAAIRYLYNLSDTLPDATGFCTDADTAKDPECNRFDKGANPLVDFYAPTYNGVVNDYVNGRNPSPPNKTLNPILQFVRAGKDSATKLAAWEIAIAPVKAPIDPAILAANASYGKNADIVARRTLKRLYIDPAADRETFAMDPPTDAQLTPAIVAELRGNLMNVDGVRSYETRRVCVDILKKLQSGEALAVLREAREALLAGKISLTGADLAQAEDLQVRIEKAIQPYFN